MLYNINNYIIFNFDINKSYIIYTRINIKMVISIFISILFINIIFIKSKT